MITYSPEKTPVHILFGASESESNLRNTKKESGFRNETSAPGDKAKQNERSTR